jgi:hypothetical protein
MRHETDTNGKTWVGGLMRERLPQGGRCCNFRDAHELTAVRVFNFHSMT